MRYSFPEGTPRGEDGDTEGISECVVADCEGSGEDAKYEEWLRRSLVLHIVCDRILQERDLREHLR